MALSPSYMVDDKTVCRTHQNREFCIGPIRLLTILVNEIYFEVRCGDGRPDYPRTDLGAAAVCSNGGWEYRSDLVRAIGH